MAGREKFQDGGTFEAVWTLPATDWLPHGKQSQWAFEADTLRRNFEVVVIHVICALAASGVVRGGRTRKPSGGVGHGTCVVFRVAGVVNDFLEADVVIIRGVSEKQHVSYVEDNRRTRLRTFRAWTDFDNLNYIPSSSA